ncbi:MAG: cation-transporting P-type ATPase [Aequorivita sp.]
MPIKQTGIQGLTAAEVLASRRIHGRNILEGKRKSALWEAVKTLFKEPMVILLLVTAGVYLLTGNYGDTLFMVVAIVLVSAISLYQDHKGNDAIENPEKLSFH